jgi:hypothetical protein
METNETKIPVPDPVDQELEGLHQNANALKDSIAQREARHDAEEPARRRTILDEKARLKEINSRIAHLDMIKEKRTAAGKTVAGDEAVEGPSANDSATDAARRAGKKNR